MSVKDGVSCPHCGLPNYEGLCPVCRGDYPAYENELQFALVLTRPQPPRMTSACAVRSTPATAPSTRTSMNEWNLNELRQEALRRDPETVRWSPALALALLDAIDAWADANEAHDQCGLCASWPEHSADCPMRVFSFEVYQPAPQPEGEPA